MLAHDKIFKLALGKAGCIIISYISDSEYIVCESPLE